jgi:hypothetical protein
MIELATAEGARRVPTNCWKCRKGNIMMPPILGLFLDTEASRKFAP